MANKDNKCSDLNIPNEYEKSTTHLADIMNTQKNTQETVYNFDFSNMTLRELADFWLVNQHSLQDEMHEAIDALGGINDGIGNSVWKYWKKDNHKAATMKISDLSEADLLELKFEIVDMLHFFTNYAVSIGMTPEEMYNMYMSKNQENRDRQKRGY